MNRMITLSVSPAVVSGDPSDDHPEEGRQQHGQAADVQGNSRPVDDPAENVPAEIIGPEEILRRRLGFPVGHVHLQRIMGGDPGSQEGDENDGHDQDQPDHSHLMG